MQCIFHVQKFLLKEIWAKLIAYNITENLVNHTIIKHGNTKHEYKVNFNYWSQNDKWKGFFFINWLFIKDIPNRIFRTIINEYNDNKPVTSSRDTQEIVPSAGIEMLKIFKDYPSDNSIFDQMTNEDKIINTFVILHILIFYSLIKS